MLCAKAAAYPAAAQEAGTIISPMWQTGKLSGVGSLKFLPDWLVPKLLLTHALPHLSEWQESEVVPALGFSSDAGFQWWGRGTWWQQSPATLGGSIKVLTGYDVSPSTSSFSQTKQFAEFPEVLWGWETSSCLIKFPCHVERTISKTVKGTSLLKGGEGSYLYQGR